MPDSEWCAKQGLRCKRWWMPRESARSDIEGSRQGQKAFSARAALFSIVESLVARVTAAHPLHARPSWAHQHLLHDAAFIRRCLTESRKSQSMGLCWLLSFKDSSSARSTQSGGRLPHLFRDSSAKCHIKRIYIICVRVCVCVCWARCGDTFYK